jgi:hypothetical protein
MEILSSAVQLGYCWLAMYFRKSGIIRKGLMTSLVFGAYLAASTMFAITSPAAAAEPWPEGLREALTSHIQAIQVIEYRTRDSTLEDPLGIQPMTSFDRAGHKCHEVPGQVYRIYKIPNYFREREGSYVVRSKFQLYYRQADSIAEIFSLPWGQGSDGAIQVRFQQVDGNWEVVESREILDLGSGD